MNRQTTYELHPRQGVDIGQMSSPAADGYCSSDPDVYVRGQLRAYVYATGLMSDGPLAEADQSDGTDCINIRNIDAAQKMDRSSVVKHAPHFLDQVKDRTRKTEFTQIGGRTATEHKGLVQLKRMLRRNDWKMGDTSEGAGDGVAANSAASMLENLTFIGEPELQEGASGIADYWKWYMAGAAGRKLCVLAGVSRGHEIKSDKYVLDRVMEHFSKEELDHFGKSIVTDRNRLNSDPQSTRVVLLDDWIISGSQLSLALAGLNFDGHLDEYAASTEVNVLTASRERLAHGFESPLQQENLPVKAYWLAHSAHGHSEFPDVNNAHITGLHSSVDYDFRTTLRDMPAHGKVGPLLSFIRPAYGTRQGLTNLDRLNAAQQGDI